MTGAERLAVLAMVLRTVPTDQDFDLGTWDCGTTACAVGWAARTPALLDEGLGSVPINRRMLEPVLRLGAEDEVSGFVAVKEFFNISEATAEHLFACSSYPYEQQSGRAGALAVSDRIREYLKSVG